MRRVPLSALALVLASATTFAASRMSVRQNRPYDIGFVPRAEVLGWLSIGHSTVAANAWYLRAVQYIGEPRAEERGWDKLYPVLDLVTELDPKHGYAYQVGGIILGSVGRVEESNAILEKGTAVLPDRYILPYLRAFNAFYYEDDFAQAGRWAEVAASKVGAPAHVRQNVLAYYVRGQQPEAAIAYLSNLLHEAEDDETRKALQGQLDQAVLERDAAMIERAIESYRTKFGKAPPALESLVTAGFLKRLPEDPFGGQYYVDGGGRVRSTNHFYRFSPQQRGEEPGITPERYEEMISR